MTTNPLTAAMTTSFLAMNIAAIIVRTLVRRGMLTPTDAVLTLNDIATETMADAETPEEKVIADSFASWLRSQATSYASEVHNG